MWSRLQKNSLCTPPPWSRLWISGGSSTGASSSSPLHGWCIRRSVTNSSRSNEREVAILSLPIITVLLFLCCLLSGRWLASTERLPEQIGETNEAEWDSAKKEVRKISYWFLRTSLAQNETSLSCSCFCFEQRSRSINVFICLAWLTYQMISARRRIIML